MAEPGSILTRLARYPLVVGLLLITGCDELGSRSKRPKRPSAPLEIDRSQEAQARRLRLIDELEQKGVIAGVDQPTITPHVWVTRKFAALDFETKRRFMEAIYCYFAAPDPQFGRDHGDVLVLRDNLSGRRVGQYRAETGLTLE